MSTSPVTLDFSKMQPINNQSAPQNQNGGVTLDFSKMQPLQGQNQQPQDQKPPESLSPSTLGGVQERDLTDWKGADWLDNPITEHLSNAGTNFIKGAADTGAGLGQMTGMLSKDQADYVRGEAGKSAGSGLDRMVGYGGENLMEFLAGDEALAGLSGAEKLLQMGKITKILEGSPKLMAALKTGAGIMKGGVIGDGTLKALLSPTAWDALQASPVLKRVVSAGIGALRAGVTQTAQTTVRTGGDVKEGLKEGAVMGGVSGAISLPLGVAGGVLAKGADAAKNVLDKSGDAALSSTEKEGAREALSQTANNVQAPGTKVTTDQVRTWLRQADNARHTVMEQGENSLLSRLEGETLDPHEVTMADKARELLANPPANIDEEHETVQAGKGLNKDLLRPDIKNLMEMIASGEKPVEGAEEAVDRPILYDANNHAIEPEGAPETEPIKDYDAKALIDLRKTLRKKAADLPYGDVNRRTINEFLHGPGGLNDTFQQLADQAGDDTAGDDYKQLREQYLKSANNIERSPYIQKLLNTKAGQEVGDFAGNLLKSGDTFEDKVQNLHDVLKPEQMAQVQDNVANNLLQQPDVVRNMAQARIEKVQKLVGPENAAKLADSVKNVVTADGAAGLFNRTPTQLDNLHAWLGEDGMREVTGSAMRDLLSTVSDDKGVINPEKAIDAFEQLQTKPSYRKLFPEAEAREKVKALAQEFGDAASWKTLVRRLTGITINVPTVALNAAAIAALPQPILAVLATAMDTLTFAKTKKVVDMIADSPKLWQYTIKGSQAADSSLAKETGKAVKATAGKGLAEALKGAGALGGN